MSNYSLDLPADFMDYEWEVEAKGWFEAHLIASDRKYRLRFYDRVRLGQEIDDKLGRGSVFFEPNLVVVESVTRVNMEKAVESLAKMGRLASLVAE